MICKYNDRCKTICIYIQLETQLHKYFTIIYIYIHDYIYIYENMEQCIYKYSKIGFT